MSFADELRRNTKSESQLKREKEEAEQKEYNDCLTRVQNTVKEKCMKLAREGHRKAEITIGASLIGWNAEWFMTRKRAVQFSNDLAELLKSDGFEDIIFHVKRHFGHCDAFNVVFKLKW